MTDPISDMFTRIRNAQAVGKETVLIPYSKFKMEIAKILQKQGCIKEVGRKGKKIRKSIEIKLLYEEDGAPRIRQIERISKPSRRIYMSLHNLKKQLRSHGFMIISTPKGVLTDQEAYKQKVGGEAICRVW
ncbi:MAG: 30S ribosomal protein S8 [Candidatus Nealsonbacteria bacterium]|nr:MAG: 30S ribosomal protein S8 [Candidatus Nealsonbacteria bacterium]